MDRVRRAGKPLIISRLPPADEGAAEEEEAAGQPRGGRRAECVIGAPALLAALTPIVRTRFAHALRTLCPMLCAAFVSLSLLCPALLVPVCDLLYCFRF
jgi:hypothetical protein